MQMFDAILVGGSQGAPEAFRYFLDLLPASISLPILLVIHLNREAEDIFVENLATHTPRPVYLVEHGMKIEAGSIYVAPANYHLLLEQDRTLALDSGVPMLYSMPSIDVSFQSAADVYLNKLIAILLTGNSPDGAAGLRYVREKHGLRFVQTAGEAAACLMPRAAIEICSEHRIASVQEIADTLGELLA